MARFSAGSDVIPPRKSRQNLRFSDPLGAAFSASRWPRKCDCSASVSSSSPPSSTIDPSAGASRPAISRSNEVLPDPLGPTTASASPELASKSRPEKTSRPPRTHLTSRPESRIIFLCRALLLLLLGVAGIVERFYKPELDSPHNPPAASRSANCLSWCYSTPAGYDRQFGIASHDLSRQLQMPETPQGWWQDLRLLQPARRREERSEGDRQASLFDEGAVGEPPAQRGRPHRQEGRYRRGFEMAEEARART